uniref:RNA-directed RNA polymerase n=1 Tax=Parascaris univalens TaxID=6257 RepID=A0A915BR60_PARUN
MLSKEWDVMRLKDLLPHVSLQQCRRLLAGTGGDLGDAVELAFEASATSSDGFVCSGASSDVIPRTASNTPSLPLASAHISCASCSSAEVISKQTVSATRRQSSVTLLILKITVAVEGLPNEQIMHNIREVLCKCGCTIERIGHPVARLQAAYEERYAEICADVQLKSNETSSQESLIEFAENFVNETGYGLSMQPLMEIRNIDTIFSQISAEHANVDIVWLAVGNMPNAGTFFIRGEYVTKYNTRSNCMRDAIPETKTSNAAGGHKLLSYATFEHDRRLMSLYFAVENQQRSNDGLLFTGYKLVLPYVSFHSVVVDCGSDHTERDNRVFIHLKYPPQLWQAIPRQMACGRRVLNMEQCRDWIRVVSWPGNNYFCGCSQGSLAGSPWLAFSIPKESVQPEQMYPNEIVEWARRPRFAKMAPTLMVFEIIARWKRRAKCPISFAAVMRVARREPPIENISELPSFRLNYAMEALIGRGSVVTDQLFDHDDSSHNSVFFRRLIFASKECLLACEESLDGALAAIDERRRISLFTFFEYTYAQKVNAIRRLIKDEEVGAFNDLPPNCVLIRKVMATPLRLILMPPEVMMTNRVVRHFGEEYALRCVFRDDNGQRLVVNDFARGRAVQEQSLIIQHLVYKTLNDGIHIASRHYKFLAWSNSQMRDHGCYMYSAAKVLDEVSGKERIYEIEDIRRWMGDFTASRNVPKLMSRMGQCFTQAQPTIVLERKDWRMEEDIMGGLPHPETGELFNFSDGAGRISVRYASLVAAKLDLRPPPSCFQVRFKGFKGVLCVDPSLDLKNEENVIFRRSQKKFEEDESEAAELEVVKHSMPSFVCLSRPLIMILDQVSERQNRELHQRLCWRIHCLLEKELNTLAEMLLDEEVAAEALSSRLSLSIDFRQLHDSGFTFTNEPFFRSLLVAVHHYNIKQHLSKLKIFLPSSMGRTMYGVIDDTGVLQYGQVFVQYSPSVRTPSKKVVTHVGPVLVTKNPCLVGGDVRMFTAVYQSSLSHLRDVIVFPRYGPRPHTDEMAGSDLDGDEYIVIFDKDLFLDHNEEAMHFPKPIASDYDTPPTAEDMIDFFLKYLSQDSIGRMSNAHLIMSDRLGLFHEICDGIARKCSIAVDFPKSGQPAEPLSSFEQSDIIPDFMQKSFRPSYRSHRLVGQLYRKVKKVENIVELAQMIPFMDTFDPQLYDESLFDTHPSLIRNSIHLRNQYNAKVQQLMDEYGITDEASVVSGHSVTIKRITDMEKEDYSYYHSDRIVEMRYSRIYESFRREFFLEFGKESDFITVDAFGQRGIRWNSALITKAKVWYAVCYGKRAMCPSKFRSFPWIVWDLLLIVKRRILITLKQPSSSTMNPTSARLTAVIEHFCETNSERMNATIAKFTSGPSRLESFVRYSQRYGRKLETLCFVVDNWLSSEGVYEHSTLRSEHVITLLLQFGIGILHGKHSPLDFINQSVFLSPLVDNTEGINSDGEYMIMASLGDILISFVSYLASERFANACALSMLMPGSTNNGRTLLLSKPYQWALLSAVAFRTFHHVALTSTFEALHLEGDSGTWDFGESDTPMVIPGDMSTSNGVNLQRIIAALKKWSGVKEIMCRTVRRDQLMISCAGSITARQCLQRLLLIEQSRLIDFICSDTIPAEARSESL